MTTPVVQHWQDFVRVVNGIRTRREARDAEDVRSAFQKVRAALGSRGHE
jgi:hypothetical protein